MLWVVDKDWRIDFFFKFIKFLQKVFILDNAAITALHKKLSCKTFLTDVEISFADVQTF